MRLLQLIEKKPGNKKIPFRYCIPMPTAVLPKEKCRKKLQILLFIDIDDRWCRVAGSNYKAFALMASIHRVREQLSTQFTSKKAAKHGGCYI